MVVGSLINKEIWVQNRHLQLSTLSSTKVALNREFIRNFNRWVEFSKNIALLLITVELQPRHLINIVY